MRAFWMCLVLFVNTVAILSSLHSHPWICLSTAVASTLPVGLTVWSRFLETKSNASWNASSSPSVARPVRLVTSAWYKGFRREDCLVFDRAESRDCARFVARDSVRADAECLTEPALEEGRTA